MGGVAAASGRRRFEVVMGQLVAVIVAVDAIGDLQGSRDGARKAQLAQMATNAEAPDVMAAAEALGLDIADLSPAIPEATVSQIVPMLLDLEAGRAALSPLTQ